jgi:hypothetical protein
MAIPASFLQSNSLSGSAVVVGGFANITLAFNPVALIGTNNSFVVKLRKGSTSGVVVTTSPPITIQDTSSIVSVTANVSSVAEGNLVLYTVVTSNVTNYSNIYFSVAGATANITSSDFTSNTGFVTIVNNTGTFVLQANADLSLMDETGETYQVQIRSGSSTGNIVYQSASSNVTLLDVSKQYNVYSATESASSITTPANLFFTVGVTNIPTGTLLYYDTIGTASNTTFTSPNTGSFAINTGSNTISFFNCALGIGQSATLAVRIRRDSLTGPILFTSNTVALSGLSAYYSMSGGNITYSNQYRIHTFNTPGALTVSSAAGDTLNSSVEVLVVGGGGGGGAGPGAPGGAGGLLYGNISLPATTYPVSIGAGGAGSIYNFSPTWPVPGRIGSSGGGTTFGSFNASGGGYGAYVYPTTWNGGPGGSGGGGAGGSGGPGSQPPSGGLTGYGYPGGTVPPGSPSNGGGGGAGGAGTSSMQGGPGLSLGISGSVVTYAAGGYGGQYSPLDVTAGRNTNTGGGGTGGGTSGYPGQGGDSGIVIVRYPYTGYYSNLTANANYSLSGNSNIYFILSAQNANAQILTYSTSGNVTSADFIGGNTGTVVVTGSTTIIMLQGNVSIPAGETRNFSLSLANATGYTVITSNNSAILKNPITFTSEAFVLAGGGGGGAGSGAGIGGTGGGGGGLIYTNVSISTGIFYNVTVANPVPGGVYGSTNGPKGANSTFIGGSVGITSVGGGGGVTPNVGPSNGQNGGSGGGGGYNFPAPAALGGGGFGYPSPAPTFYTPTGSQGYPGGAGLTVPPGGSPGGPLGGGGGAGGAGTPGDSNGIGGNGIAFNITGSPVTYGGGGGGGNTFPGAAGAVGGPGGGGNAGTNPAGYNGKAGTNNLGGGGGAGGRDPGSAPNPGGAGGSGVVILAYANTQPNISILSGNLVVSTSASSRTGYLVHSITSGTGTITFI